MHIVFDMMFYGYLSVRKDFHMKKYNNKHLTLSDRTYIEQELLQGSSFSSIAKELHKDPTTVAKEVKRNREVISPCSYNTKCRSCMRFGDCSEHHACGNNKCTRVCRYCYQKNATLYCTYYLPWLCNKPTKPPYVCNSCPSFRFCKLERARYVAINAQAKYEKTLSISREGINLTPDELQQLNDLISPLILKGQPLSHIFATHADEIPVCRRTLYNYLDQRIFQARNIDLPRRVRYKKRRKKSTPRTVKNLQQVYRNKRTYVDFERFMSAHPDVDVVEMDTVKGGRSSGKCLLTFLFRSCSFMLVILLPACTQKYVIDAIDSLTETLGLRLFRKYFPVLLTDNGSEFKNPWHIESTNDGKHRTYVFYCDPYVSNQKGRLEKNHEFIRYVIPKGRSMYKYTQDDMNLMASHINSTARDSLNGTTPFDLANLLIDKKIPLLTGQSKVSPDKILLKPELIETSAKKITSITQ